MFGNSKHSTFELTKNRKFLKKIWSKKTELANFKGQLNLPNIETLPNGSQNIITLPNDLQIDMFSFLTYPERIIASRVCKSWHGFFKSKQMQDNEIPETFELRSVFLISDETRMTDFTLPATWKQKIGKNEVIYSSLEDAIQYMQTSYTRMVDIPMPDLFIREVKIPNKMIKWDRDGKEGEIIAACIVKSVKFYVFNLGINIIINGQNTNFAMGFTKEFARNFKEYREFIKNAVTDTLENLMQSLEKNIQTTSAKESNITWGEINGLCALCIKLVTDYPAKEFSVLIDEVEKYYPNLREGPSKKVAVVLNKLIKQDKKLRVASKPENTGMFSSLKIAMR